MNDEKPHGTYIQGREIERWENAGWIFLHWTEAPLIVAVMENVTGEIAFIDDHGFAWKGANFSKTNPVPLEQYPPCVTISNERGWHGNIAAKD